ncbi:MAG: hypothetical protein LBP34_03985 [Flavobacteriaceae bacterium]|jgi:hypothetical protein|nr:hypothetical protein [Flavobacteriaceae bacterium]
MKCIKSYILTVISIFLIYSDVGACTTVIVSGRRTVDGRPLLFKQRDTPDFENRVVSFSDGKYSYIGIVNTKDTANLNVWGGHNSAGFAIMNSASYNINSEGDPDDENDVSGKIMKQALQSCKSLADFEQLLHSLPRPLHISSNFGVIDAFGGAAYYETNDEGYVKFDANDVNNAPLGYLIRTNFSFSGDRARDKGLSRFQAATELLYRASLTNSLSYDYLLNDVSRSLLHGITKVDLFKEAQKENAGSDFVAFRDYIPRYFTASVLVVQGVKADESPALTTSWITLGFPLVTPSIPVWVDSRHSLPTIFTADKSGKSRLNEWSLNLKKKVFPIERGEGSDYLNLTVLLSKNGEGIYQKLKPVNDKIFSESNGYIEKWRQSDALNTIELKKFYEWVDKYVSNVYSTQLK